MSTSYTYHVHKLQDVEWLYEEVQEAGHWTEWQKDMRGVRIWCYKMDDRAC